MLYLIRLRFKGYQCESGMPGGPVEVTSTVPFHWMNLVSPLTCILFPNFLHNLLRHQHPKIMIIIIKIMFHFFSSRLINKTVKLKFSKYNQWMVNIEPVLRNRFFTYKSMHINCFGSNLHEVKGHNKNFLFL